MIQCSAELAWGLGLRLARVLVVALEDLLMLTTNLDFHSCMDRPDRHSQSEHISGHMFPRSYQIRFGYTE